VLDFYGDTRQLFDHQLPTESGMTAGSAGHDGHAAQRRDLFTRPGKAIGAHHAACRIDVLDYRLANGVRLLVDFPQHMERKGGLGEGLRHESIPGKENSTKEQKQSKSNIMARQPIRASQW
jgi:hypothetical protein